MAQNETRDERSATTAVRETSADANVRQADSAKDPTSATSGSESGAPSETKSDTKPEPSEPTDEVDKDVIELVGPDGRTVRLPRDEAYRQFLEWLRVREGPTFAVNSVELTGHAGDEWAEITATVVFQVWQDGWLLVPLSMNEAVVTDWEHHYLGGRPFAPSDETQGKKEPKSTSPPAGAAYKDRTREAGYRWWFRGRGHHRLKLSLLVKLTKSVGQRGLQLSLPAESATSTLKLHVPVQGLDEEAVVVDPEEVVWRVKELGKQPKSEIQLAGIGSQLDVQWRSHSLGQTSSKPFLKAQTSILVNFTKDSIVLTGLQRVRPFSQRGRILEIRVTLPPGFEVLAATGEHVQNYTPEQGNKNRYTVTFTEPRRDWTEIQWTLERKSSSPEGRIALEGFAVEQAKEQTGEIAVAKVQGLRVEHRDQGNLAVKRIRVGRFSARTLIRDLPLAAAFQFRQQPFRLQLVTAELPAHVTVSPDIRLEFSATEMALKADFHVQVSEESGPVETLEVFWPGWRADGWSLEALEASSSVDKRTVDPDDDTAPIVLHLNGQRQGTFTVPFAATRQLSPTGNATFRLPRPAAQVSQPAELSVLPSANVDVELLDWEDVPVPESRNQPDSQRRVYQVDPAAGPFSARVTVHPQRIRTESSVVLDPKPFGVDVQQKMTYKIDYERLERVVVAVPEQFADDVQFFGRNNDEPLTTRAAGDATDGVRQIELPGLPTLGTATLTAVYSVPFHQELQPGDSRSVVLPLIRFVPTESSRLEVRVSGETLVEPTINADQWRRLPTLDRSPAWTADDVSPEIPMTFTYPQVPRSRQFVISRALIRAVVGPDGTVRSRAQFRLINPPGRIVLFLPPEVEVESVWIGKRPLLSGMERRTLEGRAVYRLSISRLKSGNEASGTAALLTMDYHERRGGLRWWSRQRLNAPEFPENVWVKQTVWQIGLPRNHHLSAFSPGHLAEFHWQPAPLVWARQPSAPFDDADAWIGSAEGPVWSTPVEGNVYYLRRFGPGEELSVDSMSRSLIVLFGAGVAWLLGILLVKLPRLRNVFTLLTAVLLVTIAGLWYATELQLLLQPALLGVLLAAGFVGIERFVKRRRAAPILTGANPNEFALNISESSAGHSGRPLPVGSEDPTAHRSPSPQEELAASMSSELREQQ